MTSFNLVFVTVLTTSFEFSSFLLANIVFKFSLCGLTARLNVSALVVLASVIACSYSSIITCNIASPILTLDHGIFL